MGALDNYDMRKDPILKEIDKKMAGQFPEIPDTLPDCRLTWDEVCSMFPHCWVLMKDVVRDEWYDIVDGILDNVSYYTNDEYFSLGRKLDRYYYYTTFGDGRNI